MSETREEQVQLLRETAAWFRGMAREGPHADEGWELDAKAIEAALHAFEVLPELLEACKAMLDELTDYASECPGGPPESSRIAMAAIAKAEGK